MNLPFSYRFRNQQLWLSAERLIYWEDQKSLLLSDLHFGKTGHFRKSGIAVPSSVYKEDLHRLVEQIQYFQPEQLVIAGDLFHSHENRELELFKKWRENFPYLRIQLIKGNHDILHEQWYKACDIELHDPQLDMGDFSFIHDIVDAGETQSGPEKYFFSGHLHPGIRIRGGGKQSLSFPCFYFGKAFAVIPAFSRFTGLAILTPEKGESAFAIVGQTTVQVQ